MILTEEIVYRISLTRNEFRILKESKLPVQIGDKTVVSFENDGDKYYLKIKGEVYYREIYEGIEIKNE